MAKLSRTSTESVSLDAEPDEDVRLLFTGTIVDINFRPTSDTAAVKTTKHISVFDIIENGPRHVVGKNEQQYRWIHLPANNMSWVRDLFNRLHRDQEKETETETSRRSSPAGLSRFDRVLRDDKWRDVFHGRKSTDRHGRKSIDIHGRFMSPLAARYSSADGDDSDSEDVQPRRQDANVMSLYMPYLHWEHYNSWKYRQQHIAHLKEHALYQTDWECRCTVSSRDGDHNNEKRRESLLLHQTLFDDNPLHDRRTLDQSYFYNLRNVALKDKDQVIGQNTWNHDDAHMMHRKMMMVDQLWLWVVDDKTIVTAFPNTAQTWKHGADVLDSMTANLQDAIQQGTVKSLNSFTAFIIDQCTGIFHRNDIHPDLAFFEKFADEIGKTKNGAEQMYAAFHELSRTIESFWTKRGTTVEQMSSKLDKLFSIKDEISLIADVDNILSDLDKIDFLCGQQEQTVRNLIKCSRSSRSLNDLGETLKSRREAWAGMALSAKATRDSLHSLLDLKQRQATVGEARSVRYQIELSAKQGRSIMLLTVFTVFFMPISVMATIFGMNAQELNDGKIKFSTISAIAFPTTVTLVLTALGFAFSEDARKVGLALWRHSSRSLVDVTAHTGRGSRSIELTQFSARV